MPEDEPPKPPNVRVSFSYRMCNDVRAIRRFYGDLLGMKEAGYFEQDVFGYVAYQADVGFQYMFFKAEEPLPVREEWAAQPGYEGPTAELDSISIGMPEDLFRTVLEKLQADESVPCLWDRPRFCQESYWGFPVRDPMGVTVEVFTVPKERPASTEWPGE